MRIYLDENVMPSFEDGKLVFLEKEIELGDWTESRKKTIDVPLSKVFKDDVPFNNRPCRIMVHCLRILSSRTVA